MLPEKSRRRLAVVSERQAAANRRNAQNSTGPRSGAGKKRASRNSFRHGLSAKIVPSAERAKYIEDLAREIAGGASDLVSLELARTAAEAALDLARIRQVRVALIDRLVMFGTFDVPEAASKTMGDVMHFMTTFLETGKLPKPADAAETMPSMGPERTAEAVRRALPELMRLDRYERRATAQRRRCVHLVHSRNHF